MKQSYYSHVLPMTCDGCKKRGEAHVFIYPDDYDSEDAMELRVPDDWFVHYTELHAAIRCPTCVKRYLGAVIP